MPALPSAHANMLWARYLPALDGATLWLVRPFTPGEGGPRGGGVYEQLRLTRHGIPAWCRYRKHDHRECRHPAFSRPSRTLLVARAPPRDSRGPELSVRVVNPCRVPQATNQRPEPSPPTNRDRSMPCPGLFLSAYILIRRSVRAVLAGADVNRLAVSEGCAFNNGVGPGAGHPARDPERKPKVLRSCGRKRRRRGYR